MKNILSTFILVFAHLMAFCQAYEVKNAHAEVNGETSFTSYTGKSDDLSGRMNISTNAVHFELSLKTIDTDNSLRNKHMNEALETSKYPMASFDGNVISAFDPEKDETQLVKVKGDFKIHGETRELSLNAYLTPTNDGIKFRATWPIQITDYGIERPSVMFIKVDDKHVISISGVLKNS